MKTSELPVGDSPQALGTPHFPTRQQAVIWRNWELVPPERLALVLGTSRSLVMALARDLGLRTPPRINRHWLENGYCTIIRENWNLLPYQQLLILLDWTAARMDAALREEDFLWIKLGRSKPDLKPVQFAPLTDAEQSETSALRLNLEHALGEGPTGSEEAPFSFIKTLAKTPASARLKIGRKQHEGPPTGLRLAHSYAAIGGDPLLHSGRELYPDGELSRYAAMGVNAIWLHGLLQAMYPWELFPELSHGWEQRLKNLRSLVARAAKHGIGVYLYLNEPRGLPTAAFAKHPELKGAQFPDADLLGLCTSRNVIKDYLRNSSEHVFRQVPGLAGAFTITMSEAPTNCFSRPNPKRACPKCTARGGGAVVAEVNALIAQGVHAADPQARVIAWTWGWSPAWEFEAIDRLPTDVSVMCVSEWGLKTNIGGVPSTVIDYSISQVGPSEQTVRLWQRAQARGLRTVAKIQCNNSWESSSVPWLPVPDLVEQHLGRLRAAGVDDLMLGWTLGGYPGGNLALLNHSADELAVRDFGALAAPLVRRAWRTFSQAFTELPFSCDTIYFSPLNIGPANLLHATPSKRTATMVTGFPYDDLTTWRSLYPEDIFETQLQKLSTAWRRGLTLLARAEPSVPATKKSAFQELERIARAAECHFRSTWLQVRFIRLRDQTTRTAARTRALRTILREEQQLACTLYGLVSQDSRLGFEAANHYNYSANSLREKVIQCAWLLENIREM